MSLLTGWWDKQQGNQNLVAVMLLQQQWIWAACSFAVPLFSFGMAHATGERCFAAAVAQIKAMVLRP